jgi:hypothetical protein
MCTDIISTFKHGKSLNHYDASHGDIPQYFVDDSFTLEPFTERFDNSVTGWVFNLPVIVEQSFESCNIPQPTTQIGK